MNWPGLNLTAKEASYILKYIYEAGSNKRYNGFVNATPNNFQLYEPAFMDTYQIIYILIYIMIL